MQNSEQTSTFSLGRLLFKVSLKSPSSLQKWLSLLVLPTVPGLDVSISSFLNSLALGKVNKKGKLMENCSLFYQNNQNMVLLKVKQHCNIQAS